MYLLWVSPRHPKRRIRTHAHTHKRTDLTGVGFAVTNSQRNQGYISVSVYGCVGWCCECIWCLVWCVLINRIYVYIYIIILFMRYIRYCLLLLMLCVMNEWFVVGSFWFCELLCLFSSHIMLVQYIIY